MKRSKDDVLAHVGNPWQLQSSYCTRRKLQDKKLLRLKRCVAISQHFNGLVGTQTCPGLE